MRERNKGPVKAGRGGRPQDRNKGSAQAGAKETALPKSARWIAAIELDRLEETDAYVGLSRRGRTGAAESERMITELVSGVTRWRRYLDFLIDGLYKGKPGSLEPKVRTVLRIAIYEIVFMQTPGHAAVHEAVETARSYIHERVAGLVNGMLRSLLRLEQNLPVPATGDRARDLAVAHSHPDWIVQKWLSRMDSGDVLALLEYDNARPSYGIHIVGEREAVLEAFSEADVEWEPSKWLPDFISTRSLQHLVRSELFKNGLVRVQDEAAAMVVEAMAPEPGERVLDVCAAPGGKTIYSALRMGGRGEVVASDLHAERLKLVGTVASDFGLKVGLRQMDASAPDADLVGQFDRVLVDAPCTGLGVLSKRADLRWQRGEADAAALPALQIRLLEGAAQCVREGGLLVYSTCTFEPEENEGVVDAFLERNPEFSLESVPEGFPAELTTPRGEFLSIPSRTGMDGAYAARLRRRRA